MLQTGYTRWRRKVPLVTWKIPLTGTNPRTLTKANFSFFFSVDCIKQPDFMLLGVLSAIFHRRYQNVVKTSITLSLMVSVLLSCFYHTLTSSVTYYYTAQKHGNTESVCNKLEEQLNLVSSVGRAPVCRVGGRGFKPRADQHSGSLNNWEGSAAFVMTTANG